MQASNIIEIATIGFLGIHRFENRSAIRGAILVTDVNTKPLEFRVTAPIRPQTFQEMIYGEILEEHVSVELIGMPLLDAVQNKPDLIIVRDPLFLKLNLQQSVPTVLLLKEDEPLIGKGLSTNVLTSESSNYSTVKIFVSNKFESNLKEILEKLQLIFTSRDLMEPFNRLENACEDVHKRKVGDS